MSIAGKTPPPPNAPITSSSSPNSATISKSPAPNPTLADDRHNDYVFERAVTFRHPTGLSTNGRIDQKNFDGFRVARMNDAPVQVNVHFVESGNLPTGVGEPGVPPVIAALANAIYSATGKRIREMPFSKTKLV